MEQNNLSWLDGRQISRMKTEDRFIAKQEKQEKDAGPMIGELCREGKTIYYVYPTGGRYKESPSYFTLVDCLARNRYI